MGFNRKGLVSGGLSNRIKAQKLVYFGKFLGLPLDYDFNLYLYGPYSSSLSNDYFNMSEEEWANGKIRIPANTYDILKQIKEKDELFLEVAATLHSVKMANLEASENILIETVSEIKSERLSEKKAPSDYVEKTFEILRKMKLL